jgi:hypothetical protein
MRLFHKKFCEITNNNLFKKIKIITPHNEKMYSEETEYC